MHLKLPIRINKSTLKKVLAYAVSCGHTPQKQKFPDLVTYSIKHTDWDDTPLAESVFTEGQWAHYAFVRIRDLSDPPETSSASE